MADQVTNGTGKKKRVNALMIVGVILMFAGNGLSGWLVANGQSGANPIVARSIIFLIAFSLFIIGFIKIRKENKGK